MKRREVSGRRRRPLLLFRQTRVELIRIFLKFESEPSVRLVTAAVDSFGATLTSAENLSSSSVAKYSQLTVGWSER